MTRCIEALLCWHGYRVRFFASAAAFLRSIDASTPGCVLLNLTLPDATGLDVQRQLVASGRAQPVVFISNVGAVRAVVQAIKAGAEDFIELPLEQALLMSAVKRAIERDRRQRLRRVEEDGQSASRPHDAQDVGALGGGAHATCRPDRGSARSVRRVSRSTSRGRRGSPGRTCRAKKPAGFRSSRFPA